MKTKPSKLLKLRQSNAIWQCTLRRAPFWITPKDRPPYRAFILMIVDQDTEMILNTKVQNEPPTYEEILQILFRTMRGTLLNFGLRGRPKHIIVDNAELANFLAPNLVEIKIRCDYQAVLPSANRALLEMEESATKRKPIPGLLSIPGVTEPLVEEFYAASTDYYRHEIWHWMENWDPIEVKFPPDGQNHYVLVLGIGGDIYGLALFLSYQDLEIFLSGISQDQKVSRISFLSLTFDEATWMSFADLDAIEQYNWQVAGEKAYPMVIKTIKNEDSSELPASLELNELLAVLQVLPDFVTQHLNAKQGMPKPAHKIYSLSSVLEDQKIALRYPVEDQLTP